MIDSLEKVDPEAAKRARERYSCFDHFGDEAQSYGWATAFGAVESCREEAVKQLTEVRRAALGKQSEELFSAEQNARLIKNAEEYYRSMFAGRVSSWNLRDRHMAETLDALVERLKAKVVLWEHNSHLGDARFTEMSEQGELNVGQLVRERYGAKSFLIGFTTYTGTVTAADDIRSRPPPTTCSSATTDRRPRSWPSRGCSGPLV